MKKMMLVSNSTDSPGGEVSGSGGESEPTYLVRRRPKGCPLPGKGSG